MASFLRRLAVSFVNGAVKRERDRHAGQPDPASGLSDRVIDDIVAKVRPYSMVVRDAQAVCMRAATRLIGEGIPGAIVECGVWRGGTSMAMLLAQKARFGTVQRPVHMLDSFEGLPPAESRDGPLAQAWQAGAQAETHYDNCAAPIDEVRAGLHALGFAEEDYRLVKGWFEETVPPLAADLGDGGIALLRLDGDWYSSTMTCLTHLVPLVSQRGVVILDDYYAWDGCALAVHEYLGRNGLSYRIRTIGDFQGAYFVKQDHRADFEEL